MKVKESFDSQGVSAHKLRTAGLDQIEELVAHFGRTSLLCDVIYFLCGTL